MKEKIKGSFFFLFLYMLLFMMVCSWNVTMDDPRQNPGLGVFEDPNRDTV
jgi:hypothetical protein